MIISIIVAVDEEGGIGRNNRLPWHLPSDLKRFRELTSEHHIIMGRRTYESINRPLPERRMIIISRNPEFSPAYGERSHSLDNAMQLARQRGENEVFIIGGSEVFRQVLERTQRIYLTRVYASLGCDVFFPELVKTDWIEKSHSFHPMDDKDEFASCFSILERSNSRFRY